MAEPIIGWDLGYGGGSDVHLLPAAPGYSPKEILLVPATVGSMDLNNPKSIVVDLWGLDPKLAIACAFSRVPSQNPVIWTEEGAEREKIIATIAAFTLTRGVGGITQGPPLPSDLFMNGGSVDGAGVDDGCELSTAAQGIRFVVTATATGWATHDLVLSLVCRPNVTLACRELALALAAALTVTIPSPISFLVDP